MIRTLLDVLRDAARVFAPRNLVWHLVAIALTFVCVTTGFDGWVSSTFRDGAIRGLAHVAGRVGNWTPLLAPPAMWAVGLARRDARLVRAGWLLAEAEVLAAAICAAYKAVTGRPGPLTVAEGVDASRVFRFGFLRGGIYWGWPSSHVMVAVAGAATLFLVCRSPWTRWSVVLYATFMAVCVAVSFHWFSDVVAGVIVGVVIGRVVGSHRAATGESPRTSAQP